MMKVEPGQGTKKELVLLMTRSESSGGLVVTVEGGVIALDVVEP